MLIDINLPINFTTLYSDRRPYCVTFNCQIRRVYVLGMTPIVYLSTVHCAEPLPKRMKPHRKIIHPPPLSLLTTSDLNPSPYRVQCDPRQKPKPAFLVHKASGAKRTLRTPHDRLRPFHVRMKTAQIKDIRLESAIRHSQDKIRYGVRVFTPGTDFRSRVRRARLIATRGRCCVHGLCRG